MKVLNAMQLKKGAKVEKNRMGTITQPVQFLPRKKKGPEWTAWNMDWLEWNGMKQMTRHARRIMKNYKLAKGIIDKTDYLLEPDNEMRDLLDTLTQDDATAFELKFYPIIPNIINVMVTEFAKRDTRVTYRAVDDNSYNEMLKLKEEQVAEVLLKEAEQKIMMQMQEQMMAQFANADPNDPQVQQQMMEMQQQVQQQTQPENLKKLPEIQKYFDKTYRSMSEQWAMHQHRVDVERFKMEELEERAFRDSLISDREFWHFRMMEDDYEVELWNPVQVFYHKSPDARYISQGNWVGKIDMLTVADVIDKYGYLMTQKQLEALEAIYPIRSAGYPITGYQNDGTFYDATKSHKWNVEMPGLAYRQYQSMIDTSIFPDGDIVQWLMSEQEDYHPHHGDADLLRVTTAYWKSQVKCAWLTKIAENGQVTTDIVSEEYKVSDHPVYDTSVFKNKDKSNLLFGEHLEYIWVNQTWGGVKIGPNRPSMWGMEDYSGFSPIYLGIDHNTIRPLKFQFKGDNSIYGCKLPVEGSVFSDRNTKSTAMVDLMKPYQIGYNVVNNQIADILVDELGTIILLDQNTLPRHSMNEDWGKNNLAKAYVAMKDFQMLPLDTTLANTEVPLGFQHFQTLNLEQTQRLMSRIQLATYFKQQCMEVIGVTPQRMGQQIGQTNTATGMEQAVAGSYAQTEIYFIQHSDYLMPRVHQMRTDLAQFYHSRNPSVRLTYMTSNDEKVNFEINGTDLLLRDLNIFATTNANHRAILEKMKLLAEQNNTSGASIYDLGAIMQVESMGELNNVLKGIEKKASEQQQQEMQMQERIKQQENEARLQEKQMELDHETMENEKNRRRDVLVAEIRAAGMGGAVDLNQNMRSDFMDMMDGIRQSEEFQQTMNHKNATLDQQTQANSDRNTIEREKMDNQMAMKQIDKEIAQTNKNQYDIAASKKRQENEKKEKEKKKKEKSKKK